MIPKIIQTEVVEGLSFNLFSNNKIGTSILLSPIDIELADADDLQRGFENLFRHWPEDIHLKWHLKGNYCFDDFTEHSRKASIAAIGRSESQIILHIETKAASLGRSAFNLLKKSGEDQNIDQSIAKILALGLPRLLTELGFVAKPLEASDVRALSHDPRLPIFHREFGVDIGIYNVGILKLTKSGRYPLTLETLSALKDQLPEPFEIVVQIKKISNALTQLRFGQIAKREGKGFDLISQHKSTENQEALANLELRGDSYFGIEFHIIFRRESEQELKSDLRSAFKTMSSLGDFTIENVGALPSYLSCLPGGDFHFAGSFEANIDRHEIIPCYLPVFTRGCALAYPPSSSAMAIHRLDLSVDFIDKFNRQYQNYCLNIIGQSGTGKSVFLNRDISSSAYDPNTRIIIVDVKGSHTRLVQALGGDVHMINLKESSGINPFAFLLKDPSEYTQNTIKTFVTELMLDDDEKRLSIEDEYDLEVAIIKYTAWLPQSPDLESFIKTLPANFPRLKLLKRFESGTSKKLFSTKTQSKVQHSRIHYYNFQNIDLAGNVSTSRAIMAAIMADFNFQLYQKEKSEKLIFLCDETPFFITQCFRSFKLLSKNVRSLYGSLVLTVQVSGDLIVDGDQSLIDGAGTKIFFSQDETKEIFKQRFHLSSHESDLVSMIRGEKGRFSQFMIKDKLGTRIGNLMLTGYEYWQSTTEPYDWAEIERLKHEFPQVSEDELIFLISRRLNSKPKVIISEVLK